MDDFIIIKEEKKVTLSLSVFSVYCCHRSGYQYTSEIKTLSMIIIKIDLQMLEFWVIHNYI